MVHNVDTILNIAIFFLRGATTWGVKRGRDGVVNFYLVFLPSEYNSPLPGIALNTDEYNIVTLSPVET